jgi:hypothetical protein
MKQVATSKGERIGRVAVATAAALSIVVATGAASAQSFNPYTGYANPTKAGSDGAFSPTGTGIFDFNPKNIRVDNDPSKPFIDADGDNVFHFTTITIPSGLTVKMSAKWTNGPVYLLATGAVSIQGIIDLVGENGSPVTLSTANRRPSIPGPGGYPGGMGNAVETGLGEPYPGLGPHGGAAGVGRCGGGSIAGIGPISTFLVPLVGGSGGGGGRGLGFGVFGGGGGAGGGALLISSGVSISGSGQINAWGGGGGTGGSCIGGNGAGGAIRLVAPTIDLRKHLAVQTNNGACGRVRFEAFQHLYGTVYGVIASDCGHSFGSPVNSFVPSSPPPMIYVSGIDQQAVRVDPTGGFDTADVTINSNELVEVTIQGRNIPLQSVNSSGAAVPTVPRITISSLDGADQVVNASPLAGTYEQSSSTAMIKFPQGFSRGFVRAVWTPTQ